MKIIVSDWCIAQKYISNKSLDFNSLNREYFSFIIPSRTMERIKKEQNINAEKKALKAITAY
jgi:hypothetical protein